VISEDELAEFLWPPSPTKSQQAAVRYEAGIVIDLARKVT